MNKNLLKGPISCIIVVAISLGFTYKITTEKHEINQKIGLDSRKVLGGIDIFDKRIEYFIKIPGNLLTFDVLLKLDPIEVELRGEKEHIQIISTNMGEREFRLGQEYKILSDMPYGDIEKGLNEFSLDINKLFLVYNTTNKIIKDSGASLEETFISGHIRIKSTGPSFVIVFVALWSILIFVVELSKKTWSIFKGWG